MSTAAAGPASVLQGPTAQQRVATTAAAAAAPKVGAAVPAATAAAATHIDAPEAAAAPAPALAWHRPCVLPVAGQVHSACASRCPGCGPVDQSAQAPAAHLQRTHAGGLGVRTTGPAAAHAAHVAAALAVDLPRPAARAVVAVLTRTMRALATLMPAWHACCRWCVLASGLTAAQPHRKRQPALHQQQLSRTLHRRRAPSSRAVWCPVLRHRQRAHERRCCSRDRQQLAVHGVARRAVSQLQADTVPQMYSCRRSRARLHLRQRPPLQRAAARLAGVRQAALAQSCRERLALHWGTALGASCGLIACLRASRLPDQGCHQHRR